MDRTQKRNLFILALVGLLYFSAFLFPNASTLGSDNPRVYLDRDEYVTYPIVERMLLFEGSASTIWARLIIYGDYHYGYPFYFFSMLTLLPWRLLRGVAFFEYTPFNILMLRQFINVLPMVLTAGAFTWLQTRLRSLWKSLLLFALLLSIPAVVRSNLHWWHPDSLMLLCIALTFLFLDLDEFRLGRHFYLAAVACGLAAAIKLTGLFFFLTIPLYLLINWRRQRLPLKRVALAALGFVLLMAAVVVLSNPFMFYSGPRSEMLAIQEFKAQELSEGYSHEESIYYQKGAKFWRWTLKVSYGKPWNILYALFGALLAGCLFAERRELNWLIAAWSLPLGIYLMYFVAPKPDHYLLPWMLPLFAALLAPLELLEKAWHDARAWVRWPAMAGMLIAAWLFVVQMQFQLSASAGLFLKYFK